MTLKIATWNVNSLRVRLPHLLEWLQTHQPDIVAIQETKLPDEVFPLAEINQAGYNVVFSGQRTYNGVAILSREQASDIVVDIPTLEDPQRRVLGVTVHGIRLFNLYVPNGQSVGSEKYEYKLNWLKHLTAFLADELTRHPKMILLGDFNIAPHDIDVHDPKAWQDQVLCSEPERAAFQALLKIGFQDCFRYLTPDEQAFSWWDYRLNAFKRNLGLRIDHILASTTLIPECQRCYIDKTPRTWDRPSDHTPVILELT